MSFFAIAGQMALGSRLRHLAEVVTTDAQKIYDLYGVEIDARWFPILFMLLQKDSASISELAEDIGQTHASVSQIVKDMTKHGLIKTGKSKQDARVTVASLTAKARKMSDNLNAQCDDINTALDDIFKNINCNLWNDLNAFGYELNRESLFERVKKIHKRSKTSSISIVDFTEDHQQAYKMLNEAWINKYFTLEDADIKALENPFEYIINRGGYIAIALFNNKPVGTCALLKMDDSSFELAKMTVADAYRGYGVGFMLGNFVIEKAKALNAKRLYLESNSALTPALELYRKLGFKRVSGYSSPYQRCDVQMELFLDEI